MAKYCYDQWQSSFMDTSDDVHYMLRGEKVNYEYQYQRFIQWMFVATPSNGDSQDRITDSCILQMCAL
jgi:hypothetical protein